MAWHASLKLDYTRKNGRTLAQFLHDGPLRVLQSLYPEGDGVCHNVLVHPPGGLVGGDTLDIQVKTQAGAHGLITTPGATRFYRSEGLPAIQRTHLAVGAEARLEWLPLEAICYSGCLATNQLTLAPEPGGEILGWDVTALGLPLANQPFEQGHFCQHIELPGVWLERGQLDALDTRLLNSPAGLAGQKCMASIFFVVGSPLDRARRQLALDCARDTIAKHALAATAGVTSPNPQVVVARVLAPMVEPAMALLRDIRTTWRTHLWGMESSNPRIWST
jgi:urease accessory protein